MRVLDPGRLIARATTCVVCGAPKPVQRWSPGEVMHVNYGGGRRASLRWWTGSKGWETLADPEGPRAWCPEHVPLPALKTAGSEPQTIGQGQEGAAV